MDNETRMLMGLRPWGAKGMTVAEAQALLLKSMGSALNPLDKNGRPVPNPPVLDNKGPQVPIAGNRHARTGMRAVAGTAERNPWTDPDTPGWCRATGRANVQTMVPWHRLYEDVTVNGIYDCFNKDGSIERVPGTSRNRDWLIQDDDERRLEGARPAYPGGYKDISPETLRYDLRRDGFDPAESHVPELREWARRYRSR